MTKRLFDVVVAASGLLLTAPLLLLVAVATWLTAGRPVVFRQQRIGRGGRPFHIHKFRTMREAPGASVTSDRDPRLTEVGRILRATKLDELPQLYDVLLGRMSLVGPRPEVLRYVVHWPREARRRILAVRPGITDPASIAYRNESTELARAADPEHYYLTVVLPRKVEMYLRYVRSRSFRGDLRILLDTVRAVLVPSRAPALGLAHTWPGPPGVATGLTGPVAPDHTRPAVADQARPAVPDTRPAGVAPTPPVTAGAASDVPSRPHVREAHPTPAPHRGAAQPPLE